MLVALHRVQCHFCTNTYIEIENVTFLLVVKKNPEYIMHILFILQHCLLAQDVSDFNVKSVLIYVCGRFPVSVSEMVNQGVFLNCF